MKIKNMTPSDEKAINAFGQALDHEVEVRLALNGDEREESFRRFCRELSSAAPKIRVRTETGEASDPPAIHVGKTITYHAIPLGPELPAFLGALAGPDHLASSLDKKIQQRLHRLDAPADLRVFIAPHCPHCPRVVEALLPLAAAGPRTRVTVIDGSLFTEMAEARSIRSAPTVLLDEDFRWTGSVQIPEIVEIMGARDPARLGVETLRDMLQDGDAERVAGMMLEKGEIFPNYLETLVHEKFPTRLGAMVALEYIAHQNPTLAAAVVEPLWERIETVEETVRGDIIHVIGETASRDAVPRLESIAAGSSNEEIVAAVEEALEKIRTRESDDSLDR
ncbi:MAG: hypothetical protein GY859_22220 [Desulfobacterales bacterium]|nr:hypothetical protein [Desulfobacterales bacterium]